MFTSYLGRVYSVPAVITELRSTVTAGTEYSARGIWLGKSESSTVLELIVGDGTQLDRVFRNAHRAATALGESAILVTAEEISAALIADTGDRLPITNTIMATIS